LLAFHGIIDGITESMLDGITYRQKIIPSKRGDNGVLECLSNY